MTKFLLSMKHHSWYTSRIYLANEQNRGYYTWTIGIDDGVDLRIISADPRFGIQLDDPTSILTSTGHPPGFIDSTLKSRGFLIKPNITTSSSSSTLVIIPSTSSLSQELSVPSPSRTTSSASTTPPLHSDFSRSAVASLATGFCVISILALIAVLLLNFQRRNKNLQAENADLVARMEGPAGANSNRQGLQASLNVSPCVAELSAFHHSVLSARCGK